MPTIEDELAHLKPVIGRLAAGVLFAKRVVSRGLKYIPASGPVILVSNHCGAFKDVAAVFKIVARPVFFNANRMLFDREEFDFLIGKHLRRHFRDFGQAVYRMIGPLRRPFVRYISTNIGRIGTIPADMYDKSNQSAVALFMEYLRAGRAVVSMQGRGRVHPDDPNPYVRAFGRGVPYIAYRLKSENGLDVPVVPLSIFGSQRMWGIPGKIRVNIGPPLFVKDYLGPDGETSVERFRAALQAAVELRLVESLANPF
jgi:1-acyl-sn-glycerol-3-phosphate acyltransferase